MLWLATTYGAVPLSADVINYADDEILLGTTVNITSIIDRPSSVSEVFALIEGQTNLRFLYVGSRLPLRATLVIESAEDTMSLARLFSTLSALVDVVFQRRDLKIVVRSRLPADKVGFHSTALPNLGGGTSHIDARACPWGWKASNPTAGILSRQFGAGRSS